MILLISSVFSPEPVVSALLSNDLAVALSESEKVTVISPKPSRPFGFNFQYGTVTNRKFEHIIINSFTYPESKLFGRIRESYSFGMHVFKYIRKNQTKIKCIYLNAWPLLAQYFIVKAARRYSIPSVIHIQDIYPESLFGKLKIFSSFFVKVLIPLDRWIQKKSTKVVTISNKMKCFLIQSRQLEEHKVDVVYNWQDEEGFINHKNTNTNDPSSKLFTFMFLGSLNITASVNVIINAFIRSNIKNTRLVIAGNGAEKDKLISLARSNSSKNNIVFWDAPMTEVPAIQDKADVLLLNLKKDASLFALPSKLSAYMFSKKPIIACVDEASETADIIKKANCGWIVLPEEINKLADAMQTVESIPLNDLHCYGMNGFNYALKNFSKKNNLKNLVTIILDTLKS